MSTLETFLSGCRAQPKIVSVTAEEPTAIMMAQITPAFALEHPPTLFRFVVESAAGTHQPINIIVPYEIWSKIPYAPVDQLLLAANRFHQVGSDCHCQLCDGDEEIYFLRPDIVDSVCLRGHVLSPISEPSTGLATLLGALDSVPNVERVQAYQIVDPKLLEAAGCENAVNVTCDIVELASARIDDLNNLTDRREDRYQVIVPQAVYNNPEQHADVVAVANQAINPVE